jgi:hypothetical protein
MGLELGDASYATFEDGLYDVNNRVQNRSHLQYNRGRITCKILSNVFKKRKDISIRYKYIRKNREKLLVGLITKTTIRTVSKRVRDEEVFTPRPFTLFSISNKHHFAYVCGNKRIFKNSVNKQTEHNVHLYEKYVSAKKDWGQVEKALLETSKTQPSIKIYELHLNQLDRGKKFRGRIYANKNSDADDFARRLLKSDSLDLSLDKIMNIKYIRNQEKCELAVRPLNENKHLLIWKKKGSSSLRDFISNVAGIETSETALYKQTDDSTVIKTFFREPEISPFYKQHVYQNILDKYAAYGVSIDNGKAVLKHQPFLENLSNILRGQNASLRLLYLQRKHGMYFPSKKYAGVDNKELIEVKVDGKIHQYLLINHEAVYNEGLPDVIRKYFAFIPFLILDFREQPPLSFQPEDDMRLIENSGIFISKMASDPNFVKRMILDYRRTKITQELLVEYFKIGCSILKDINKINAGLSPQQRGALFETLCFCTLSRLLLTDKLGGPYKEDGRFILEDEEILYDAKNLKGYGGNQLLKSITRKNGRLKDSEYIRNSGARNYVFILKEMQTPAHFDEVKQKIESEVPGCVVSAITLSAIKDMAEIYSQDDRAVKKQKLKSVICSGTLKTKINKEEIT